MARKPGRVKTARIHLDVKPETKEKLKEMADSMGGHSMTSFFEMMVGTVYKEWKKDQ